MMVNRTGFLPAEPLCSGGFAGKWDRIFLGGGEMTQGAQILMIVWGALILITAVIYVYRSRLTRDEDDQIYLDDAFSHEKAAQAAIAAKVAKVEPILKAMKVSIGVVTLLVIGYWIWDIIVQFK